MQAAPPDVTKNKGRSMGGRNDRADYPAVSLYIGPNTQALNFLEMACELLGEPNALRCFTQGNRVAFIPADPDHPHSYKLTRQNRRSGATMSAGWLKYELEMGETPQKGRYKLERDGDLWIVDFDNGPVDGDPQ